MGKKQKRSSQKSKLLGVQPSPFTRSRGHLIDALSKPHNAKNRNLKNMADSFDVIIEYPKLKKNVIAKRKQEETASRDFILKNLIIEQWTKMKMKVMEAIVMSRMEMEMEME